MSTIQRIGIPTGGVDAPGLNAVIRATVLAAGSRGWSAVGIRDGFNGVLTPRPLPQGRAHSPARTPQRPRAIAFIEKKSVIKAILDRQAPGPT